MSVTYTKKLLSGSVNGKSILVTGWTAAGAVTAHTAVSGTNSFDEVYLYAFNSNGSSVPLNLYWGSTSLQDTEVINVPANVGRVLIADGRLLNNSLVVSATSSQAGTNALQIDGFVNAIV